MTATPALPVPARHRWLGLAVASARLVTAVAAGFILAGLVASARLPKERPDVPARAGEA